MFHLQYTALTVTIHINGQGRSSWSEIAGGGTHDHVVLTGASPTGPTSNGQPHVEDIMAYSMEEELSEPSEAGYFLAGHCYYRSARGTRKDPPW
jgi:hypothetical protein